MITYSIVTCRESTTYSSTAGPSTHRLRFPQEARVPSSLRPEVFDLRKDVQSAVWIRDEVDPCREGAAEACAEQVARVEQAWRRQVLESGVC